MSYPLSYLLGPIFIMLFFFVVVVAVSGFKYILTFFMPKKKKEEPKPVKKVIVKHPRSIRSIEIDPKEVDRIYVKKSS